MMNLFDVIKALESAQGAVSQSLEMVRSLVGSVPAISEPPENLDLDHTQMAADIVREARRYKTRKTRKTRKAKGPSRAVRSRAAAESWAARRAKKQQPVQTTPGAFTFRDYVLEVLGEAKKPMLIDDILTEMSKKGWTTTSSNPAGMFTVMMKSVPEAERVAPKTWVLKNGKNGR